MVGLVHLPRREWGRRDEEQTWLGQCDVKWEERGERNELIRNFAGIVRSDYMS